MLFTVSSFIWGKSVHKILFKKWEFQKKYFLRGDWLDRGGNL